ncbi:hypothetical protein ABK040_013711 [Willaertia magna]
MKVTTLSFVFLLTVLFFAAYPTIVATKVSSKMVPFYCKYAKIRSCSTFIAKWNVTCKCLKRGSCGNCIQNNCGCNLTIKKRNTNVSQSDIGLTKMVKEMKYIIKAMRYIKHLKYKGLSDYSWVKPGCFRSITRTFCPKCECIKRDNCDRCQETVCGKCRYVQ